MSSGRYFEVDRSLASQLTTSAFLYKRTKNKDLGRVIVVFDATSVNFYVSGTIKQGEHISRTISRPILALNLSHPEQLDSQLTKELANCWHVTYPIGEWMDVPANQENRDAANQAQNAFPDGYAGLAIFGSDEGSKGNKKSKATEGNKGKENKECFTFRQLMLDFMYDWYWTNVFETSAHFRAIDIALWDNLLWRLIHHKAAYYYAMERLKTIGSDKSDEHEKYFWIHNLAECEAEWINSIRLAETEQLYLKWNKAWLKSPEDEYKGVTIRERDRVEQLKHLEDENLRNEIEVQSDQSTIWFLKRYSFRQAFKVLAYKYLTLGNKTRRTCLFTASFVLGLAVCLFILGFIHAIGISYFVLGTDLSNMLDEFFFAFPPIECLIITVIIIVGVLLRISKINIKILTGFMLPRLIIAITSAWILVIGFSDSAWRLTFYISLFDIQYILLMILLLILMFVFLIMALRRLAPSIDIKRRGIIRAISILGIGLLFSVCIGGVVMGVITDKTINHDEVVNQNQSLPQVESLTSDYVRNRYLELAKNEILDSIQAIYAKPLSTELLEKPIHPNCPRCFAISVKSIFGRKIILPHMLLFNSVFALFIGLFLQLVLEERGVTDNI